MGNDRKTMIGNDGEKMMTGFAGEERQATTAD